MQLDQNAALLVTGSIYAPIFYDYNDTTFYLDPNSTGLSLSSNGIVSSGTGTAGGFQNRTYTGGRNRIWSFGNADGYGISYFQGGPDYIGLHVSGSPTQAGSDFWVSSQGVSQTSGSSRAPIFYDSNNTAYYLDPNGGSRLGGLTIDSINTAPVLNAIAGGGAAEVGTYGFMRSFSYGNSYVIGQTVGGSVLNFSAAGGANTGTGAGTWRCMGYSGAPGSGNYQDITLWLRIS